MFYAAVDKYGRAAGSERAAVTGRAAAVRGPAVADAVPTQAVDEDVRAALGIGAAGVAAVAGADVGVAVRGGHGVS